MTDTANKRLTALKEQALSQKRRVLFDNDGGDVAQLCLGPGERDLINTRTKPALDAGIDTYIYTTGWGFGIGLHDSRVGSVLRTREGHLSRNMVPHFTKNGRDCLRIISEFARSAGKECFWGMRMNDTHDQGYGGVFMPENRFKNAHPEVLLGEGAVVGGTTAVDYSSQTVRDFAVSYMLDVVDNYDIDGLFLDFFRHPVFFQSNAGGSPATEEEVDAMNSLMRTVKTELDTRRLRDERYYLNAVRVPDSLEYGLAIGLDVESWLREGLVDILFTTSYLHLNDWAYSVELAHNYNVPVYPSLDESRVRCELPRHKRNCVRGYYGRIMNAWEAGCDGILMFNNSGLRDISRSLEQNWFSRNAGNYREGLTATVKGRDYVNTLSKTYFVSFRGVGSVAGGALPHEDFIRVPTLNHRAPILIEPGKGADVPLRISDDLDAAGSAGKPPTGTLSVFVFGNPHSTEIGFNGTPLQLSSTVNERADLDPERTEYVLTADVPRKVIRKGLNAVRVTSAEATTLLDVWMDLDYPE